VQSILGHDGVLSVTVGGGRTFADREIFSPWGDKPVTTHNPARPWPGSLPTLVPTTVYRTGTPVELHGVASIPPAETLSEAPRWLVREGRQRELIAWSGPWPIHERWWDGGSLNYRLQAVDTLGTAWVLLSEEGLWTIEARYD
jgi:protein ImuB